MRRVFAAVSGVVVSTGLLVLGLGTPGSAGAQTAGAVLAPGSPIKHVVIIYQENHTFDDVLGEVCQTRATPCDGYVGPVTMADGVVAANIVQPDIVPAADHSPRAQRYAMHNKWDHVGACTQPPYQCVSHVNPANIPNLANLADTYAVSDATFAAGQAASFGAHVTLGGGTFDGFTGGNPGRSRTGEKPGEGWGCGSNLDAPWGAPGDRSWEPSCVPDLKGKGPYRASRVPYAPTIMQRIEERGLSWHIYEGDDNDRPLVGPWSVCTYFAWCWLHRFENHYDSNRQHFIEDATAGHLPNLSILLPTGSTPIGGVSQHNGNSMRLGDNYIGDMVGAVMDGPDWDSTAIFITYDDCGCFYDHVQPPRRNMGLRNPMVIISPWVKRQYTDSAPAIQPYSVLAFTEHVFGLRKLTPEVSGSYDYAHAFDFDQRPLPGISARMVDQSVPQRELRRLAVLAPLVENDPT